MDRPDSGLSAPVRDSPYRRLRSQDDSGSAKAAAPVMFTAPDSNGIISTDHSVPSEGIQMINIRISVFEITVFSKFASAAKLFNGINRFNILVGIIF